MKRSLRKKTEFLIIIILVVMMIALFQFKSGEDVVTVPENQIFYEFNDDWIVLSMGRVKPQDTKKADRHQNNSNENTFQIGQEQFSIEDSDLEEKTDLESKQEIDEIQNTENTDEDWSIVEKALTEGKGQKINLPFSGKSMVGETIIFRNVLPKEYAGLTLDFYSTNSSVRVILDGKIIYQFGIEEQRAFGKSPGSNENFVDIPEHFQEGELWIELTSSNMNAAATLGDVMIAERDVVIIDLIEGNIMNIVCCLLMIISAIVLIVLAIIRIYTHQPARGELFLGTAVLLAGIYYFIETKTLSVFYNSQTIHAMIEYICLLLLPLLLTLYFEKNLRSMYPRRFLVLMWFMDINVMIQMLLQILDIRDLADMVGISVASIVATCTVSIVSLIHMDLKNKNHKKLPLALAMFVLLTGGTINGIINKYTEGSRDNTISQYSMVIFGIMMTIIHVLILMNEYRKSAEESAKLLKKEYEMVEQQNKLLIQAKKDADSARLEALSANEAKGKFLANMSHEIRTPINAILGMDEMILRESKEQNVKDYAMDIYTAGQTLLSLINDILDFSKIESGKMEIVPAEYEISSMIHDLFNMISLRAKDKNLKLIMEVSEKIPSRLFGDDVRIRQVLTNILTNAVKYTQEGTVWFRVQGNIIGEIVNLWFEVEDTGIGIKEEDLPKLSAEFERIEESRNRNIEGTGLGMNITLQLLSLMGSRLQVESVYGKGSKFYFELEQKIMDSTPIGDFESRVHQLAEGYQHDIAFCAPQARVLVVDDNAVNRKVFRSLLKQTQIQVTEAESGKECLKLVQEQHFNLIFLDYMMPELDGVETLHQMKALPEYLCQDTPVIVLTANAVTGSKERYLAEGFDEFLSKPIISDKLEKMIKKLLPKELIQAVGAQISESSTIASIEDLPQIDGLDWNYAWMHLPDMELLGYTVREFYLQIDSAAKKLTHAFEKIEEPEQLELYRIQVHAMKSLAATVGIVPLAGLAKVLEFASKDGKIDIVLSMTPVFLEEWRSYREKLQGVFGIEEEVKKEVTDFSVMQALVEMLRISMQDMDIDQADDLIGKIRAYEYPAEMEETVDKLADAVTGLDLEETDRLANLLIVQMSSRRSNK